MEASQVQSVKAKMLLERALDNEEAPRPPAGGDRLLMAAKMLKAGCALRHSADSFLSAC